MRFPRPLRFVPGLLAGLLLTACGGMSFVPAAGPAPALGPTPGPVGGGDSVYLWVAAWQDAYVSCDFVIDCGDSSFNHGGDFQLLVAYNDNGIKNSYVEFALPMLPPGTVVEEAYLELYHDAMNEDGRTDDVSIPVAEVSSAWDSQTINYDNQPMMRPLSQDFTIRLNSMDWSGSGNIADIVRGHVDDPARNNGFMLFWDFNGIPPIEKGFNSLNNFRRPLGPGNTLIAGGMTYGPRLLLRVTLPAMYGPGDIVAPLPNPDDAYFNNGTFPDPPTMAVATGADWPADWETRRGGP